MTVAATESDWITVFLALIQYGMSGDKARELLRRLGAPREEEHANEP